MVIPCLCSFTALRTLAAEPPINKKRTRTLFRKEPGSSTNCIANRSSPVDIPSRWDPHTNQSPTGALIAFTTLRPVLFESLILHAQAKVSEHNKKEPPTYVSSSLKSGAFSTALEPKTSSREIVLESSVKLKLSTTRSSKT